MSVSARIINSLLDTDLYKYTMQQVMVLRYPDAQARMAFRCRSGHLNLDVGELRAEIDALADLQLSTEELRWLSQLPYIKPQFIEWLKSFRLDPTSVTLQDTGGDLKIEISGNWAEITHFEIFILAIVSELHSRNEAGSQTRSEGKRRLLNKIDYLKQSLPADCTDFRLVDFGTRRRFSRDWQEEVVSTLKNELPEVFAGTSNLYLARKMDLAPVGTMAHEWLQAHQALGSSLQSSQKEALNVWLEEYGQQLGIALTDTISMKAFLQDFDKELATSYSGIRHDSGDPILWGEQALNHYGKLGIDSRQKSFVFSDKLDFRKTVDIYQHFTGRARVSFGIGTYLTNDMGFPAPNIVLKLVEVNQQPVAKLSDTPAKVMCQDERYVEELKRAFA